MKYATAPPKLIDGLRRYCPQLVGRTDCWIAGGIIRSFFDGSKPKDMDVYFRDQSHRFAAQFTLCQTGWTLDDFATVPTLRKEGRVVQLCLTKATTAAELVSRFDFTACAAAIDGHSKHQQIVCADSMYLDVAERRLQLVALPRPVSTLLRLARYTELGYMPLPDTIRQIHEAIAKLVPATTEGEDYQ